MSKRPRRYVDRSRQASGERQRKWVRGVGGTLVAAISFGSAVLSFQALGLTWWGIAIVALSVALLISLFAHGIQYFERRLEREKPKQIAFLTPSNGEQPYYSAMLAGLLRSAALAHGQDYLIVPSMPSNAFEEVSIWSLFSNLEDRQVDISGIVFIPDLPDDHFDELIRFHADHGDVPLLLVDVYFDPENYDQHTRRNLPSFVGGDEVAGGKIAANVLIHALATIRDESPVIVLVHGGVAPWERQRSKIVKGALAERWPAAQFLESDFLNYSRSAATAYATELMMSLADANNTIRVDGIFACNDDMAIGVRSAVLGLQKGGYNFLHVPQVVGYDGIPEMREYIRTDDLIIAGTVDTQVYEQAKNALLMMHTLLRSRERSSKVTLIPPKPVMRADVEIRSQNGG